MSPILRALFVLQLIGILIYTGIVVNKDGWDLISVFFGDLSALNWSGQFNFDFMNYLILSAIWVIWRHNFSPTGIVLGLLASVLGILFFAPYLLFASMDAKGDLQKFFMGVHANS